MTIAPTRTGVLLFFMLLCVDSYPQRRIDKQPTTAGCIRQAVIPLKEVPPLRPDMSSDCIDAYMFFDSLCRARANREELDSALAKVASINELKPLLRYRYLMSEYDATLYGEYRFGGLYVTERSLPGPTINSERYLMSPGTADYGFIQERMTAILGPKHKLSYLTNADLILRIRVDAVIDDVDRLASIPIGPLPLKCVTATITDTIKGIHIRQCVGADPATSAPCVSFYFSPVWQKENYYPSDAIGVAIDDKGVAHYPCDNCYRDTSIYAGKEYLVFLDNSHQDFDGTNAYYAFMPLSKYSAEGGIFPILPNGNVLIPSDYFGYGREVPYDRFLELIRKDIEYILTE